MHRLGKARATYDSRDLQLAHYLNAAALPPIPKSFGHETLIGKNAWSMLGNGPDDSVKPGFEGAGDCVFAGACHETMMWNKAAGRDVSFTGANAIADYSAVTGYVIGKDSTDQGTDVRTALKYRQKVGIIDSKGSRHKLDVYLALEPGNLTHLWAALYLFEAVGIGIEFPESADAQFAKHKPWSVVSGAQLEGGHYIPLVAKRSDIHCVTWGSDQQMTQGFYKKYCDEAWTFLTAEMLSGASGKSLEGFNLSQLQSDIAALKVK